MQLCKADVVDGAIALLDAEGLDGLTMRKLATTLDVQAGALYWHFDNKAALLEAMAEKLVEGVGAPLPPGPWDQQLTVLATRLRERLLAHRDGARVVAGTYVAEPNTLAVGTASATVLTGAGIPVERAWWAAFALFYFVLGHTIEEQAQRELPEGDDWEARVARAPVGDSVVARARTTVATADPAERFAYGLALFIDGIRGRLP
jgi:TetR/AcrR family transcriptional regulator, tetracycline repressor protein